MRTTTRHALAIASTLTTLGGLALATATAAHAETTTTTEKGVLVECTGTWRDRPVVVSVYENRTYGNEVLVAVGAEDQEAFSVTHPDGRLVRRGAIQQEGRLDGRRFALAGPVARDGDPVEVHEEFEDDNMVITVDGVHKPLAADLVLTWRKRNAVLECSNAFRYDLVVTKTDIE